MDAPAGTPGQECCKECGRISQINWCPAWGIWLCVACRWDYNAAFFEEFETARGGPSG
jgi:hypothetical protein